MILAKGSIAAALLISAGFVALEATEPAPGIDEPKSEESPVMLARARADSVNHLKQIILAMHNYHNVNGHFPPAVVLKKDNMPLLSWRVLILPYIEQANLFNEFNLDEAWDSPHNKALISKMPKTYAPVRGAGKEKGLTYYQVFSGGGAIFDGTFEPKLQNITDGTSNTIAVIEAGTPVPWTKPVDLAFDPQKPLPKLGGLLNGAFNFALADGSVHFCRKKYDEKILRAMITSAGGEVVDTRKLDAEE